jgi:hypothetical protein
MVKNNEILWYQSCRQYSRKMPFYFDYPSTRKCIDPAAELFWDFGLDRSYLSVATIVFYHQCSKTTYIGTHMRTISRSTDVLWHRQVVIKWATSK